MIVHPPAGRQSVAGLRRTRTQNDADGAALSLVRHNRAGIMTRMLYAASDPKPHSGWFASARSQPGVDSDHDDSPRRDWHVTVPVTRTPADSDAAATAACGPRARWDS